jgi:glycosyltransferase involved in cell wall biosynthesis
MRVLINTVPLYGKGEGARTYTTHLLQALHQTDADMEWHVLLRRAHLEAMGLAADSRFHLIRFAGPAQPPGIPGIRFASRNVIDQMVMPLRGRRFDAVHFLDTYGPLRFTGSTPFALTIHDLFPLTSGQYFSPWVQRYLSILMRGSIPRAAAIMAISEFTARALVSVLGIPADRIRVVPNGVEARFHPTSQAECARVAQRYAITAPYLLSIGTIEPRKNLARIISAFARVKRESRIPHHLLIVGKLGWSYDDVIATITKANLGEAIRLIGYLPREDIPPLITGADALVQLALEEGFGLPVAEGMACGAPIITSAGSALAEVAGDAGYLVDPTSETAIAQAFTQVCSDNGLRLQLRKKSLRRANMYTWGRTAHETVEMYRRIGVRQSV